MKLRETISEIDSTYGEGVVAQGSRGRTFKTRRWQCMVFDVDLALGGGFPWRKFIQIYGPESGGKSVLMYKAIAGAQMYCRYCRELFMVDENGEDWCECPSECADCGKEYEFTEYTGPPVEENDPFDWEKIHDEWVCECLVLPKGKKAKKDRVQKVTRRAARCRMALFDAENSFDKDWAEFLGVDCDYLFVFVPEYAEQGIDIADKLLRSQEIDVLGIDSIAELTPSKEIESSTEEWQMGLAARLVNKAIRKWNSSINALGAHNTQCPSVILINQERANLGGYEAVCPGGAAQKYKSSIRIRVNTAKYKFKESGSGANKIKEMQFADMSGFTRKNKCVTGDTAIFCPDALEIVTVGELANTDRIDILGWHGSATVRDEAASCEEQRIDEIIKISVSGVGEFRGNADHPVLTGNSVWKKLGEIQVGDLVPVPYIDLPEDSTLTPSEGRLLGLLTGDGWVGGTTGVSLTSDNPEIVHIFSNLVEKFDCEVYPKDELHWVVRNKGGGHSGKPNKLYSFLREHGMWGKRAWDKIVPPDVFRASGETRRAFLEGLVATDGYVAKGHRRIGITTVSRNLAEGLRVLCSSLGVRVSVRSKTPKEGAIAKRVSYEVRAGGHHATKLAALLGWVGGKEKNVQTWPNRLEDPIVPVEWAQRILEAAKQQGATAKEFAKEMGYYGTGWSELLRISGKKASRLRCEALARFCGNLWDAGPLKLPLDFAIVEKIEMDGEEMVYDICGTDTETFIAQGLIVHNTYAPMKQFSYRLYLDDFDGHPAGTTNELSVIVDRALEFEVIERPKATQYTLKLDDYDFTWSTQKAIVKALAEDHALMWAVRDKTMATALEMVR